MKIAFLFPGQGSQAVGMGRSLGEAFPAAKVVFDAADQALGSSLSGLCFNGPEDELKLTENTQPALLAASVAALRALESRGIKAEGVAGHSLGEYSALVAANALSFEDAVRTVRLRGRYMQEAVPVGQGAMAAILMLMCAGASEITARTSTLGALGWALGIFVAGWALQFWGHHFEGMKPAFYDDVKQLLIGPVFVLAEAFFIFGAKPELRRYIEDRVGPTVARRTGGTSSTA
jgi:hypothetical protein